MNTTVTILIPKYAEEPHFIAGYMRMDTNAVKWGGLDTDPANFLLMALMCRPQRFNDFVEFLDRNNIICSFDIPELKNAVFDDETSCVFEDFLNKIINDDDKLIRFLFHLDTKICYGDVPKYDTDKYEAILLLIPNFYAR